MAELIDRLNPYKQITDGTRPDTDYCNKVLNGHIPAGQLLKLQCEHHLEDLETGEKRGLYYFPEKPIRFFGFCKMLLKFTNPQGLPERFRLFSWMIFATCLLDGWRKDVSNPLTTSQDDSFIKRYRNLYLEAGRGGGKSYYIAARQAFHVGSELTAGRSYLISSTFETTKTAFMFLNDFIENSPPLLQRFMKQGGFNPYAFVDMKHNGGLMRRRAAPSSQSKGSYGLNISHLVVDEFHDMTNKDFLQAYETSFKATKNPQSMYMTNAGNNYNTMCGQRTLEAARILKGEIQDDTRAHLIYRVDDEDLKRLYELEDDDYESDVERLLILAKSCPAMPVTPNPAEVLTLLETARKFPGERPNFERLYLSQWVEGLVQWLSLEQVDQMMDTELPPAEEHAEYTSFMGIDLSETDDFTSATMAWEMPDGSVNTETRIWIPNGTLTTRENKSGVPYSQWAKKGYVSLVEGDLLDYHQLALWIIEMSKQPGFQGIVYDRHKIKNLTKDLFQAGGINISNWRKAGHIWAISHSQTHMPGELAKKDDHKNDKRHMRLYFPRSIALTERLIRTGKLKVRKNIAVRAALRAAAIKDDGVDEDNRKIVKSDTSVKVDPAVSLVQAVGALEEWKAMVAADNSNQVPTAEELKRQLEELKSRMT